MGARFKTSMRSGCPCELLVRAADGSLLENFAPRLDPGSGSYVLDFAGRAKLASCKNMLMFKHAPTGQQLIFRHGKLLLSAARKLLPDPYAGRCNRTRGGQRLIFTVPDALTAYSSPQSTSRVQ